MVGKKDLPMQANQLTGSLTWAGPEPTLFAELLNPWAVTPVTILGVMIDSANPAAGSNKQFKAELKARPKGVSMGDFQPSKSTKFDRDLMFDEVRITIAGSEVLYYNRDLNVYSINGNDQWAQYRAILGE